MLGHYLETVKQTAPLIHNITNYVTVNDCANVLLACGASPIMSDELLEVEEITTICGGLNLNIGTLNERTIPAMFVAGKKATQLDHPILLDPVGAGASALRTKTACDLINSLNISVIRGNISEIKTLALGSQTTQGVDANLCDLVTDENLDSVISFVRTFSKQTQAIIAITGAIDIVSDEHCTYIIRNGHSMMSTITGTGCMLSAMTSAYLVANKNHPLEATVAAVCAMGLAGQIAHAKTIQHQGGTASFKTFLIDTLSNLTPQDLDQGAHYEIR